MTYDYSTGEVPLTQYTSDWLPNPFYFSPDGVYELPTRRGSSTVQRTPPTSRGCSDRSASVYGDTRTARSRLKLVLAWVLEGQDTLAQLRSTLSLCAESITRILSEGQAEHLPPTKSDILDLRRRASQLDPEYSEPIQPGRTSGADKHSTHWGAACFGDGWAYYPRSKGSDQ